VSIGAYIGIPIVLSDGSLFGTLCAIDPDPKSEQIQYYLPTIELLAKLLSTILENELKYNQQARHLERVEAEAMNDVLTQVYNRRGWEKLLSAEEKRCQRYGHPAGVICIDLDDLKPINDSRGHAAGDQLIYQAAQTIDAAVREQDIIARVGGDEFAVLAIECNAVEIQALAERVQTSLAAVEISASVGCASRHPSQGLSVAVKEADQKMYEHKRGKKSSSLIPELKCS
jgi:diguanylate cyclase (GGDEF)-like protein